MKEEDVLKLLEIDIKGLKKILAENLNMKSKDIKIEYDKGVFNINGGKPFISLKEHECFDGTGDLCKSIFYGLPVINPLISYDKPIGGEVCLNTDLFVKCNEPKYPTKRSNRCRKIEPVGYQKAPKGNEILRKGHILFAWLVDRFFHETEFLPVEKKMMYFTQLRDSNEPVNVDAASLAVVPVISRFSWIAWIALYTSERLLILYLTPVNFSASAKSRCISCFVPPYTVRIRYDSLDHNRLLRLLYVTIEIRLSLMH